jgi:K+-transporting ATPase KdpF subunit
LSFSAWASPSSRRWGSTPARSKECEAMTEPVLGLLVAVALAIYLAITLIKPERF